MTEEEQLQSWLLAKPFHNNEKDVCCPDFSCCNPKLLAPLHEREFYVGSVLQGNEETAKKLLKVFLKRYFDAHPTKNRMPNSGIKKE
jgi:hypothetical protein